MFKLAKRGFSSCRRRDIAILTLGLSMTAGLTLAAEASPFPLGFGGAPVVQTNEGPVQGFQTEGVTEFRGIPYAAPPVGSLRWKPPVSHARWTKVLQATSYGSNCPQLVTSPFAGPASANEDCLFLNVFTQAANNQRAKLPVIVWIHGGGNTGGEGSDYDGSKLVTQGHTVVVTINYRLGLLGFLANPALDAEGHPFANYGTLDQQFVLQWVKRNIANFGGDPNNVTLGGQSAGSIDTEANVISPLAKGLFNHAIFQSKVVEPLPLTDAETDGTAFAVAAGCGSGATSTVATCLRNLTVAQILAMQGSFTVKPMGIVADGQILPAERFVTLIAAGKFNHIPIMSGTTEDDLENFVLAGQEYNESPRVPFTPANYTTFVNGFTGPEANSGYGLGNYPAGVPAQVTALYPLSSFSTPQLAMDIIGTDALVCEQRAHNRLFASHVPVYYYEFADRTAPFYFPQMPGFLSLSYHTADIQYLFTHFHGGPIPPAVATSLNAQQEILSDQLVAAWTNLAWTGNPNGRGNFPWPTYNSSNPNARILSEGLLSPQPKSISGITLPPPEPAPHPPGLSTFTDAQFNAHHHCDFWDGILTY
jgi:para-nitrobenzyl esterase